MNTRTYAHTQPGWVIILALDAALVGVVLIAAAFRAFVPGVWVVIAVLALAEINFFALTVTLDSDKLQVRFGIGLIRFTFPLTDIVSARNVGNPWFAGWGIRYMPDGLLLNVSGMRAVEIETRSGKKYRIGSDQPEALESAIKRALGRT